VIASPPGSGKSLASNYSKVDLLELRYKSVNFEAGMRFGVTFHLAKRPPIGLLVHLKDVRYVNMDATGLFKGCLSKGFLVHLKDMRYVNRDVTR